MTKLEAIDEIRHRECIDCVGNEIGCGSCAYQLAIECIQHCIDEEDDPCYDCDHSHCNNCLYSGRIPE